MPGSSANSVTTPNAPAYSSAEKKTRDEVREKTRGGTKVKKNNFHLPVAFFSTCNASVKKSNRLSDTPKKEVNMAKKAKPVAKLLTRPLADIFFRRITEPI